MRTDNTPRGIVMMLGSVTLFAVMNVLIKLAAERYPVLEVTFFRNAVALVPVALAVAMQGGFRSLRTERPGAHLWRAGIGLTSMTLMFWSFHLLPLADAVALNFTAPLFLTALSVPLLGERVGVHRWSAVAVGFVGVLVMSRPGSGMLQFGALVAICAAFAQSLAMVQIRQLSRTEPPNTIVFWFTLTSTVLCGIGLPFVWVAPATWADLGLLAACGLTGGMAQLFLTRAYALAPAAVIAPFSYASILCAALFGWLLWGEVPQVQTMAGVAIVVASGLYILHRETRRNVAVVQSARAPEAAD
ncbi:DMT family transporter [Azospirillum sp.]|uniref:DMT family transporter n=1 Tax=Azospirillum sp. TaxID=34012 RepID=UPI002D3E8A23|nr:DMT family transporter [Azospirillum sp.]HYD64201.1 DMT family transporter [Azospirillum sp.]